MITLSIYERTLLHSFSLHDQHVYKVVVSCLLCPELQTLSGHYKLSEGIFPSPAQKEVTRPQTSAEAVDGHLAKGVWVSAQRVYEEEFGSEIYSEGVLCQIWTGAKLWGERE